MNDRGLTAPTGGTEGVCRGRRRIRRRALSPALAALLSFIWPGLGQAYAELPRRALFLAVPPALLLLGALALALLDPATVALSLLAPAVALAVIGVVALHGAWRVFAIFDAWSATRPGGRALLDRTLPLVVLLSVLVIGAHVGAGIFVQSFAEAGARIFTGNRPDGPSAIDDILGGDPSASPPAGSVDPNATLTPLPGDTNGDGVVDWNDDGWLEEDPGPGEGPGEGEVPEPEPIDPGDPPPSFDPELTPPPAPPNDPGSGSLPDEGPINVLFVGLDSGLGRDHSLSDTLIVASYYPGRDKVTMISIPRDMGNMPLYTGGVYPRRINTFLNYARGNPGLFPEGPIAALMKELGYVLGTKIHFYAATNLEGLPRAVDEVGGVTITVTTAIHSEKSNYFLEPGTYHFNGAEALQFARVRYGSSDFARARRQQQVIRALAARVRDPAVALRLPEVINALSEVVRTNVPRDQASTLLRILDKANDASAENIVLSPSRYARRVTDIHWYMIEPNIAAIRDLSRRVFGPYSRYD